MPVNVEIKARTREPRRVRALVESLSDTPAEVLHQEDVFFDVPAGRLKLRMLGGDRGELIHYLRADEAGPRTSEYTIAPTSDPEALRRILRAVMVVKGTVRKERLLYHIGQTRVHLDRVEGLGEFLELEVVLRPSQSAGEGVRIAREILERLEIPEEDMVLVSYLDLLQARSGGADRG